MDAESIGCIVGGAGFLIAALGCRRLGRGRPALVAGIVGLTFAAPAAWPEILPITAVSWLLGGLVAVWMASRRYRRASATERHATEWIVAAVVVAAAADAVVLALSALVDHPDDPVPWLVATFGLIPLGAFFGQLPATARVAERVVVEAIVVAGLALLVVAVYLVVVLGLGREPEGSERDVFASSLVAALVVALLALPTRIRLTAVGQSLLGRTGIAPEQALATFGARMTRAVPFDELLLQLAESLRETLGPAGAEVWVGTDGALTRTVSVPDRPEERMTLDEHERSVVGRTRIGGNSWAEVWLPQLIGEHLIRIAPAAHGGELLGLLVARRPAAADAFTEEDDRVLVDLGRQVGLALHNVRLDSALQASLDELKQRNEELVASRLRIVTAADQSRREIERNLHDGAQQHLVALSVKLGLARELIAGEEGDAALELMEDLRVDVQATVAALRELAHGIYPPLLRNHGLGQALTSAARRSTLPCTVDVELEDRFPEQVEAAVYFCCLEAMQNAGKYAGPDAEITVEVSRQDSALCFAVIDDGAGFNASLNGSQGYGFVNMTDRLGAIGGNLFVESAPGQGTTIRGEIPVDGVKQDPVPAAGRG